MGKGGSAIARMSLPHSRGRLRAIDGEFRPAFRQLRLCHATIQYDHVLGKADGTTGPPHEGGGGMIPAEDPDAFDRKKAAEMENGPWF